MIQLYTHGELNRDQGVMVISTSYYALIQIQDIDPDSVRIRNTRCCPINDRIIHKYWLIDKLVGVAA